MRRVWIDPISFEFALLTAHARQNVNVAAGVVDIKCADEEPLELNLLGVRGECAACLALGIDPRTVLRSDAPDSGADVSAYGTTWSVKTCFKRDRNLIVPSHQEFETAAAMLVWPTDRADVMDIVGAISREEFILHARWADHLPRPAYMLGWRRLGMLESFTT